MNIEEILEEINREKAVITATQERLAVLKEMRDNLQKNNINNLIVGQMYSIDGVEYLLYQNRCKMMYFIRINVALITKIPDLETRQIHHDAISSFKIKQLKSQEHREMAKQVMKFITTALNPHKIGN